MDVITNDFIHRECVSTIMAVGTVVTEKGVCIFGGREDRESSKKGTV